MQRFKVMSGLMKASIGLTFISFIGMLFGLTKQIIVAKYYGTTYQYDIFLIAVAIPSIIGGVSIGLFSSSIIPVITPIKENKELLKTTLSNIFFFLLFITIIFIASGIFLTRYYLSMYTPFTGEKLSFTVEIATYCWIITGIEILNNLFISFYHLKKVFFYPALVHLLLQIGIISGVCFGADKIGIYALVKGWLLGAIFCLLLLTPILKTIGLTLNKMHLFYKDKYLKEILVVLSPVILGTLPFTIVPTIDGLWASRLPEGSMSSIGYCTQITIAIDSLVKNGLYFALLPYLSENYHKGQDEIFWHRVRLILKYLFFLIVPIVTFIFYFRVELISFIYQRGNFTAQSTAAVSNLLPFYLIGGLMAMVPVTILHRAYYARKMYFSFAFIGLLMICVYFTLSGILSKLYSVKGIGFSYAVYWACFLSVAIAYINKRLVSYDLIILIVKIVFISIIVMLISNFFSSYYSNKIINAIIYILLFVTNIFIFNIDKDLRIDDLINRAGRRFIDDFSNRKIFKSSKKI